MEVSLWLQIAPYKGIQHSLGFSISGTGLQSLSVELLSFTFNGTQIPRAVFWLPKPRVPDTTSIHFPDFLTLGDTKTVFHSLVPRVLSYPSLRKSGNEVACFIFIGITFSTNKNLSLIILTVLFCRGKQINVHEAKYTELVETWYSPCSILSKISKISRLAIFFFTRCFTHKYKLWRSFWSNWLQLCRPSYPKHVNSCVQNNKQLPTLRSLGIIIAVRQLRFVLANSQ